MLRQGDRRQLQRVSQACLSSQATSTGRARVLAAVAANIVVLASALSQCVVVRVVHSLCPSAGCARRQCWSLGASLPLRPTRTSPSLTATLCLFALRGDTTWRWRRLCALAAGRAGVSCLLGRQHLSPPTSFYLLELLPPRADRCVSGIERTLAHGCCCMCADHSMCGAAGCLACQKEHGERSAEACGRV